MVLCVRRLRYVAILRPTTLGSNTGRPMSLLLLFSAEAPWQSTLVATAKRLASEGHCEVAVVTALMACETAAERTFAYWFRKRGIAELEDATTDLFPSYSLANERVRKYYVAMSGDKIHESAFWPQFKAAAKLRGEVVHGGSRATQEQAEEAVGAAAAFTEHLAKAAK